MLNAFAAGMILARRSLLGRARWLVTLAVFLLPVGLALVARRYAPPEEFGDTYMALVSLLYAGILVPYIASYLGSAAVSDEIEGRTLVYLWTRPVGRAAVFACKFAALALWLFLLLALFVPAVFAVLYSSGGAQSLASNAMMPVWDTLGLWGGAVAYAALAFLLATLLKKPLVAMLLYIAVDNISQFMPGFLKLFFIRHYVFTLTSTPEAEKAQGVFKRILETAGTTTDTEAAVTLAVAVVVLVAAGAVVLNHREYLGDDPARAQ
jgi:ABC-type transport system involved in multi-copper enzyme maturation permease subunit